MHAHRLATAQRIYYDCVPELDLEKSKLLSLSLFLHLALLILILILVLFALSRSDTHSIYDSAKQKCCIYLKAFFVAKLGIEQYGLTCL